MGRRSSTENQAIDFGGGSGSIGGGGGLGVESGGTLRGLEITHNIAQIAGGVELAGDANVSDCVISYNEATEYTGGGVSVGFSGPVEFEPVTLVGNTADGGGGGLHFDSSVTLVDREVTDDAAVGFGGQGGGAFTGGLAFFRLISENTDWGAEANDNSPDDFAVLAAGLSFDWAGIASFDCTGSGC